MQQNSFLKVGKTIKIEIDTTFSCLNLQGTIKKLDKDGLIVKTYINYDQKGSQRAKCTIIDDYTTQVCLFETIIKYVEGNNLVLVAPKEENIQIVQRRKYIRVPINNDVNCYLVRINRKKVESGKIFPGVIKNIGGGGVLLNSPLSVPVGTVLVFEMELDGNTLLLTIEVLRKTENEEDGTNDLGCQFIGINDKDRQKIITYCNRQQLTLRRKKRSTNK